jgi:threonine-phosphate decarboxylase
MLEKFEHGGDVYSAIRQWQVPLEALYDFSANINPLVTVPWLKHKLDAYWEQILHYPDPNYLDLLKTLSVYHGVNLDTLALGNGATSLIHGLVKVLDPKRALLIAPTFSEYEKALLHVDCTIDYVEGTVRSGLYTLEDVKAKGDGYDILFLCNPNNPTGQLIKQHELVEFIKSVAVNQYVVIDEAFIDFTPEGEANSLIPFCAQFENVIVLRSATKFYGIPGLRLGYLISSNVRVIKALVAVTPIWQINVFAAAVVMEGLKDLSFQLETRLLIAKNRKWLYDELTQLGFCVYESEVNYMLIYMDPTKWPVVKVKAYLARYHVLIRDCSNYRGLPQGMYRIAVKGQDANAHLVKAFTAMSVLLE